jgi:hypothetical protein
MGTWPKCVRVLRTRMWWGCALSLLLLPASSRAYKIDTHVWIGQQVLNDVVPDGRVTINGREYPVPQHVWRALADHASIYRMGSVGTDVLPDIMAAQMAVHPGVPGGWDSGDWLRWVSADQSSSERTAFAMGYLGHAAADVFGHSYVNTYSGDVFWLTDDGEAMEQEVELRHIALESYIARHTPPLRDALGNDLGPPSGLVTMPSDYLRDRLLFNREVKQQYQKQLYTKYLAAMAGLSEAVKRARDAVDEIDGVTIPAELARMLGRQVELERRMAELASEAERLQNDIVVNTSLVNAKLQSIDELRALVEAKRQEIDALSHLLGQIAAEVERRNALVGDLQNQLANTVKETCNEICKNLPPGCGRFPRPPCAPFCEQICQLTAAWVELNNRLQQAILGRDQVLADYNAKLFEKTTAEQTRAWAEVTISALEAERKILQEQIDLATSLLAQAQAAREQARADLTAVLDEIAKTRQLRAAQVLVLRTMLEHWHRDIGLAASAYVDAWGEVAKRMMDGTGDPLQPLFGPNGSVTNGVGNDALAPVSSWLDCWAPVFMGVPKEAPNATCRVRQSIDVVVGALRDLKAGLGDLNWLIDPVGQLEAIVLQEVEPTLAEAALEVGTRVGAPAMTDLIRLVYFGATADTLNEIFSRDSSSKRLLLIRDVARRADADMGLTPDGHFDSERFRAVRNAVVLAKMALLEPAALNDLATQLAPSLAATVYGATLYPLSSDAPPVNVLDFVKSIDGNQQWQQLGLPYHRRGGARDPQWPWEGDLTPSTPRTYSHGFDGGKDGFRFWEDPNLREHAFRDQTTALFRGPLAPGVEYPQEHGLSRLVPRDYPFRSCPQNPFPRTTNLDGSFQIDSSGARRDPGCDEDLEVSVTTELTDRHLVIHFEVTNIGAERAQNSSVALYLSTDATLDPSDQLVSENRVPALAAGERFTRTVRERLRQLAPGNYFAIARVDPAGRLAEAREDNNTSTTPLVVP